MSHIHVPRETPVPPRKARRSTRAQFAMGVLLAAAALAIGGFIRSIQDGSGSGREPVALAREDAPSSTAAGESGFGGTSIALFALAVLALASLAGLSRRVADQRAALSEWPLVLGRVLGQSVGPRVSTGNVASAIGYAVGGKDYVAVAPVPAAAGKGDAVAVLYDPADPRRLRTGDELKWVRLG